jgi:hypothetical protein
LPEYKGEVLSPCVQAKRKRDHVVGVVSERARPREWRTRRETPAHLLEAATRHEEHDRARRRGRADRGPDVEREAVLALALRTHVGRQHATLRAARTKLWWPHTYTREAHTSTIISVVRSPPQAELSFELLDQSANPSSVRLTGMKGDGDGTGGVERAGRPASVRQGIAPAQGAYGRFGIGDALYREGDCQECVTNVQR